VTREPDAGGGGLTGATGHLTPDATDDAFDPGERREVDDPDHRADVTVAQVSAARARTDEVGDTTPGGEPGQGSRRGGDTMGDADERF
jgi:hypothetical protein